MVTAKCSDREGRRLSATTPFAPSPFDEVEKQPVRTVGRLLNTVISDVCRRFIESADVHAAIIMFRYAILAAATADGVVAVSRMVAGLPVVRIMVVPW